MVAPLQHYVIHSAFSIPCTWVGLISLCGGGFGLSLGLGWTSMLMMITIMNAAKVTERDQKTTYLKNKPKNDTYGLHAAYSPTLSLRLLYVSH